VPKSPCVDGSPQVPTGVEIRGRPIVRDHHFLGKDNHVLTDGSPSDGLIFALITLALNVDLRAGKNIVRL
jgi:hypothetical protein